MKLILLLFVVCAFGLAHGRPQPQLRAAAAAITKFVFDKTGLGGYKYEYESDDGQKKEEEAEVINQGTDQESIAVRGSYSYVGNDGQTYEVKYTADENGYQPEGEHIPPSAGVKKLGIPSAALASLAGGGVGR